MGLDQNLFRKMKTGEYVDEIYWRKANFVHAYFTEDWMERGFENDNLTDFPATVEQLQELVGLCEEVLENKYEAEWLLPTMSGFFFGGTDYDEWYFHDVQYTKEEIEKLLKERPLQDDEEFVYRAWY